MKNQNSLPEVIILYGPPASGKGTQANLLSKHLDYIHFDFGACLRQYVVEKLGGYPNVDPESVKKAETSEDKDSLVALKALEAMLNGQALESDYVWYIVADKIEQAIANGQRLILEGIGRTYEDGKRFGQLAFKNHLRVAIFHICVTEDESVRRAKSRYYIPNSSNPYLSYDLAKNDCKAGEEPWQRPEDVNEDRIRSRYKILYSDIYAKVLSTLQMESRARMFIIDGRDTIEEDFNRILLYIENYYISPKFQRHFPNAPEYNLN